MKQTLLIITIFLCKTQYAQNFTVGEKQKSKGYVLAYFEYNDTVDFSKNKVAYCFVKDNSFNNECLTLLYNEFKKVPPNAYRYFVRTTETIECSDESIAVLRGYFSKYGSIIRDTNQYNDIFRIDIKNAANKILDELSKPNENSLLIWMMIFI